MDYHKVEDKLQYGLCTRSNVTDIVTGDTYHEYVCEMRYNKKQFSPYSIGCIIHKLPKLGYRYSYFVYILGCANNADRILSH